MAWARSVADEASPNGAGIRVTQLLALLTAALCLVALTLASVRMAQGVSYGFLVARLPEAPDRLTVLFGPLYGPAYTLGLRPGDAVLGVDGVPANDPPAFGRRLWGARPGERHVLRVTRAAGAAGAVGPGGGATPSDEFAVTAASPLASSDFAAIFTLGSAYGLVYLAAGVGVALLRPAAPAARPLLVAGGSVALTVALGFWLLVAGEAWPLVVRALSLLTIVAGCAHLHLFAVFPAPHPLLERRAAGGPAARWSVVGRTALLYAAPALALVVLLGGPPAAPPSPSRVRLWSVGVLGLAGLLGALGLLALLRSYRRAPGPVVRAQLKWILWAMTVALVAFTIRLVVAALYGGQEPVLVVAAFFGAVAAIPVAIGIAVVKHRLFDIDFVISKTVVYGVLALFLTAVYVVLVAGVGAALGATGGRPAGAGGTNLPLSLVATAIVAAAFQPLRLRLERLANRLVYGQRATPYEVLADLSRRLAGALSVEEVLPRLAEAAARGVGATHGWAEVSLPRGGARSVCWPEDPWLGEDDSPRDRPSVWRTTVTHRGETLGVLAVAKRPGDPLTPAETALLRDLAAEAGLALRNVRLTLELRARLDELAARAEELRASRERLVAAQDAERRRLERDLHDGAQRHLVALAVQLGVIRPLIDRDPAVAAGLVDEMAAQVDEAMGTLRDLARGIFPPLLADRGVVAALQAHLVRACPEARLDAAPAVAAARFAPPLEAAVYFCCLEALQNASKHAAGAPVAVRLTTDEDGWLAFAVRDDGRGFDLATTPKGSGLQNMVDRLAALGGTLTVDAAPGRGTTVAGRVPIDPPPGIADGDGDGKPLQPALDAWPPVTAGVVAGMPAARATASAAEPNAALGT